MSCHPPSIIKGVNQERFGINKQLLLPNPNIKLKPKIELMSLPEDKIRGLFMLVSSVHFQYLIFMEKYNLGGEMPFMYDVEHYFAKRTRSPCQIKNCPKCVIVDTNWGTIECMQCKNKYKALKDSIAYKEILCFNCNTREKRKEIYTELDKNL